MVDSLSHWQGVPVYAVESQRCVRRASEVCCGGVALRGFAFGALHGLRDQPGDWVQVAGALSWWWLGGVAGRFAGSAWASASDGVVDWLGIGGVASVATDLGSQEASGLSAAPAAWGDLACGLDDWRPAEAGGPGRGPVASAFGAALDPAVCRGHGCERSVVHRLQGLV